MYHFSEEEYRKAITTLKNGKVAAIYDIQVDQLNTIGSTSHKWLLEMPNKCFIGKKVTRLWTVKDHRHTETWQRFYETEELQTNIFKEFTVNFI